MRPCHAGLVQLYAVNLPAASPHIPKQESSSDDESLSEEWQPPKRTLQEWQLRVQAGGSLHVAEQCSNRMPATLPQPASELEQCCCIVFDDLHRKGCAYGTSLPGPHSPVC